MGYNLRRPQKKRQLGYIKACWRPVGKGRCPPGSGFLFHIFTLPAP
jgi:hypothetical protein